MKKILALCLVVVLAVTAVTGATLAYFTDTTEVVENTFTMGKVKLDLDEALVDDDGKEIVGEDADRVKKNDYTTTNMVPGHEFDKDPTIHVEAGSEESYIFLDMTINKYSSLFWVMAADAAADAKIELPLYETEVDAETKEEKIVLHKDFKNDKGAFSTTKFLNYLVANKDARIAIVDKWFNGIVHEDWQITDIIRDGDYLTIRFAYNTTVNAKNAKDNIDIKFMDSFQMPASVTQEMIENGIEIGKMENNFNTAKAKFVMDFVAYAIQADEMEVKDENGKVTKDGLHGAYEALFGIVLDDTLVQMKSDLKAA